MRVVLYEPEIPPNTGNIARLCAAFAVALNLIEPLGFSLEDRYLKRAGLDYWPHVRLKLWSCWEDFTSSLGQGTRLIMATTKGAIRLPDFKFQASDCLVFGPETRGLPDAIRRQSAWNVKIPIIEMGAGGARSLNLATSCGIMLYTALAQTGQLPG